jgi:DNA-binding response OmpR family regulator
MMMLNPGLQKKILIVDDDPLVLDILAAHLSNAGFFPVRASSGTEAWELIAKGNDHFAAAIVDRMMPQMDGTQLTKKIKSSPVFSSLPVIMLTSAGERAAMIDAVQGGVFDFLVKPVEKELLMLVLRRAIGISEIV